MILHRCLLVVCPLTLAFAQTPPQVPSGPTVAPLSQIRPETVVLRVGAMDITAAQFEAMADSLPGPAGLAAKGSGRKQFAEQLAAMLVLAQEGYQLKLDENPRFQIQSRYRSEELMAGITRRALRESFKIDDGAMHEYYDAHKSEYERTRARHILIRTSDSPVPLKPGSKALSDSEAAAKARSISQQLKNKADFAILAATDSDDTASAAKGGELGWLSRGDLVPAFEQSAFQLKPGEISEPVRTPFGYHIIQVEGHEVQGFDQVKGDIEDRIVSLKLKNALDELQKRARIDYNPAFFETDRR